MGQREWISLSAALIWAVTWDEQTTDDIDREAEHDPGLGRRFSLFSLAFETERRMLASGAIVDENDFELDRCIYRAATAYDGPFKHLAVQFESGRARLKQQLKTIDLADYLENYALWYASEELFRLVVEGRLSARGARVSIGGTESECTAIPPAAAAHLWPAPHPSDIENGTWFTQNGLEGWRLISFNRAELIKHVALREVESRSRSIGAPPGPTPSEAAILAHDKKVFPNGPPAGMAVKKRRDAVGNSMVNDGLSRPSDKTMQRAGIGKLK